jgi:hypothetical protein
MYHLLLIRDKKNRICFVRLYSLDNNFLIFFGTLDSPQ